MLNIPELEKRWLHYKIKSYLPISLIILLLIVSGSLIYSFFPLSSAKKREQTPLAQKVPQKREDKVITIPKKREIKETLPDIASLNNKEKEKISPLSPSMHFIQKLKTVSQTDTIASPPTDKENRVANREIKPKAPKGKITIIKQDTKRDIQNILKRFEKEKNPALSLFLARKYYALGNYKAALKYALITNQLNKDIDESWIIFSKTLVKMHHKEKAINILRQYIQNSQSTNAAILLQNIQSGRFQ
ncbi:Transformation system protein [hydrothermal vent metagenome]|uniref:Transformation system protein n=1 Tax=hydrothermal vent metagenome TaxID=652676 RepID=A0A1W1BFP4_9ZZZZ